MYMNRFPVVVAGIVGNIPTIFELLIEDSSSKVHEHCLTVNSCVFLSFTDNSIKVKTFYNYDSLQLRPLSLSYA